MLCMFKFEYVNFTLFKYDSNAYSFKHNTVRFLLMLLQYSEFLDLFMTQPNITGIMLVLCGNSKIILVKLFKFGCYASPDVQ